MIRSKFVITIAVVPALLIALAACSAGPTGNRTVVKEPGKTITVIENTATPTVEPGVAVSAIDTYENVAIADWLDEDTVVAVKPNEALGRMSLEELADEYPRSLYLYHLDTEQYEILQERENAFLGDAELSPDKKHLLYSEFSLGDPVYHVMNLDTKKSFRLTGEPIAGAMSAHWADDGTVIGPAYAGGAFTADTGGTLALVEGLPAEGLIVVRKMNGKLYYTSNADETLHVLDLATKERTATDLTRVARVHPAPDGKRMIVLQYKDETDMLLTLSDADGGNSEVLAEGAELGGVSWSPDQRLIAYSLKAAVNGSPAKGLYVYDLLTGKTTQIAVDVENAQTSWSPSGQKLAYTVWDGDRFVGRIVHLTYTLP